MRRIATRETLHGTRDGQLAIDEALAERFGLTERESACAALLKLGGATQEIAERLAISTSTAEKHLVALRRKLGVSTTLEAVVSLFRLESDATSRIPEAFGLVFPVSSQHDVPPTTDGSHDGRSLLAARLREAATVEDMLALLLDDLREDGVEALFYSFLPMAAASFRKGDLIQRACASRSLRDALREDAGVTMGHTAARLFAEPDRDVVLTLDRAYEGEITPVVAGACARLGLDLGIALGSPFGTSYVVLTAFGRSASCSAGEAGVEAHRRLLRDRLLLLQNVAYSFGALARTADLTLRERDALAMIASGHTMRQIAEQSSSSERAVGQLLGNARKKLRADTTAEAVARAMALNALVFL